MALGVDLDEFLREERSFSCNLQEFQCRPTCLLAWPVRSQRDGPAPTGNATSWEVGRKGLQGDDAARGRGAARRREAAHILVAGWSVINSGPVMFAVAVYIQTAWHRTNEKHQFRLELLDADGEAVVARPDGIEQPIVLEGDFECGRPPGLKAGTPLDRRLRMGPRCASPRGLASRVPPDDQRRDPRGVDAPVHDSSARGRTGGLTHNAKVPRPRSLGSRHLAPSTRDRDYRARRRPTVVCAHRRERRAGHARDSYLHHSLKAYAIGHVIPPRPRARRAVREPKAPPVGLVLEGGHNAHQTMTPLSDRFDFSATRWAQAVEQREKAYPIPKGSTRCGRRTRGGRSTVRTTRWRMRASACSRAKRSLHSGSR